MGKRAQGDDNAWEQFDESALQAESSLLDANKHSLFQRINLQRATYFADVEGVQAGPDSQSGIAESHNKKNSPGGESRQESQESAKGQHQLPSDFADLPTWCCDVFQPAGQRPASLDGQTPLSLTNQPTIVLPRLTLPFVLIADMETVPALPVAEAPASAEASLEIPRQEQKQGKQAAFRQKLWQALFTRKRRPRQPRQRCPARSKGRELLLARLDERRQRPPAPRVLPTPPGGKRGPITRPPVDRLFG